ncbi:carboxypeptidase-like regulatory domain-containing protein [Hymenobacter sp. DH14]|uniref:Carboxypeptidase-like regulatory domain-containing protein n=1 Tax=Hymenobacter cyanobacteriorum TaxID=2926463 RepID=A0A9X1VFG6_9BACT|nr:carboxypeptidase-like regulatory domain-containing protein [Hymenobacter cyanobacteriorum]MCI1188209.1 carboxypeptidase-like regulatory domain-containing protein [Hymenobacter cyanobacteriorum]
MRWLKFGFWMRFIGLLVWLLPLGLRAQNAVLRGRVLDAETHQPIPNAQVGVADNRLGTSTNDDGRFVLSIPPAYARERLTVALLGYRSHTQPLPPLPGPELRIELRISPAALGEVQVTGSVEGIVREAVARIPRNYPARATQLTGFYRESDNDSIGRPRYLVEGLLTVFKPDYRQPADDGDVQIRQARKVDLRPAGQAVRIDWAGGPFIAQFGDFVHRRAQFINPKHFRDYAYRLAPGSSYAGRPVYVVDFGPRNGSRRADCEGRLYIDQSSYAFLGAEWHFTATGLRRAGHDISTRRLRVAYQPYAGRWHLKTVWWQTRAKLPIGPPLSYFGEFLATAIDTANLVRPGYVDRAQEHDVFLRTTVAYDSAFWAGQTTLLPSVAVRQALLDQRRQQRADSLFRRSRTGADSSAASPASQPVPKESGLLRFLSRLSYGVAVGAWPLAGTGSELAVDFAPAGSGFALRGAAGVKAPKPALFTSFAYQFALSKSVELRVASTRVHGQFEGEGWQLGLSYQRNLRPRHRPLYGRAGLAYAPQSVARPVGTFDNPDAALRVAGTNLGADRLSARLQTFTQAVLPTLGLGLELTHQFELVADAGYLLPLRTRAQLQLAEESGFFLTRSSATRNLPDADVVLRVNGQPATSLPWQPQHWVLSVGLHYRLRP